MAFVVPFGGLSALDKESKSKLAAELVAWVEQNVRERYFFSFPKTLTASLLIGGESQAAARGMYLGR